MKEYDLLGPWPDVATARLFLKELAMGTVDNQSAVMQWRQTLDVAVLADWLVRVELAGVAYGRYGGAWPELRAALQRDRFLAAAEWELHDETLAQLLRQFAVAGVTAVLLKGAALALTVYPDRTWRTMSDVDAWVQGVEMAAAVTAVRELGFGIYSKEERPWQLQQLSQGEVQLYRTEWAQGLVELHWSAFQGWWLLRVAQPDANGVWARKEPLSVAAGGSEVYQLAAEDMVLQVALHLVINHQLGMKALQGLLDIALTAQGRGVDWAVVAGRAKIWRVRTAVYTVLYLLDELIGVEGVEEALAQLRPSRLRRWLIGRFVSPESVLAGRDLRNGRMRHLFLLILVDRLRDMAYLVFRTLWPESEWMQARYGGKQVSRWRHLWRGLVTGNW
ncbi:MAG: nucleotidyltransferase family protein [Ardenticatenaceae bacterium]|nr:nucleotidyltransferase family protein [Ardenticatenaceae bacterium]MCB9005482.1 nucleotidyltransferase family protein [Ardenticatenaceae bacterium]